MICDYFLFNSRVRLTYVKVTCSPWIIKNNTETYFAFWNFCCDPFERSLFPSIIRRQEVIYLERLKLTMISKYFKRKPIARLEDLPQSGIPMLQNYRDVHCAKLKKPGETRKAEILQTTTLI